MMSRQDDDKTDRKSRYDSQKEEEAMESGVRELSIYVHIPFCKAKCVYCDFLSFGGCRYDKQKRYVSALCRELEAYKQVAGEYIIKTIFIGGGTPSYMDASFVERIMQKIRQIFKIDAAAEITIEGNPDSLTREKLIVYRKLGINRLSIGLQSTNDEMLRRLGRVHNYDQFIAAYNSARQAGFNNINIDLMSGLPGESMESYIRTLGKVVQLQPEHISAYSLIVEEGTPLCDNEGLLEILPSEELDRLLYGRTKTLLQNSGYSRYEISNYAKRGFECRHNIVYWRGGEYLGVGLGAASYLTVFLEGNKKEKIRFHGIDNLDEYTAQFEQCTGMREDAELEFVRDYYKDLQFLKRRDEIEEFMFLGLRMMEGISKKEFQERFGEKIESVYGKVLEKYKDKGFLLEQDERIYLSDAGIDVSNVVMAEFML